MATRSVQVGGESLTLCLDCGALLHPSSAAKHNDLHKQLSDLAHEVNKLKTAAKD
jgi:hypothetical protein